MNLQGLASAEAGIESALLTWSAASSSWGPVTDDIYHSTASGAQDFGSPIHSTQDLTALITPLNPGSTSQLTHYFVVPASDACGGSETNTMEMVMQPLLHPDKDQDGDGMSNLAETALGSDPTDRNNVNWPKSKWMEQGGSRHFALDYIRRKNNPTAVDNAELSLNLINWNSGPAHTVIEATNDLQNGNETLIERMVLPLDGTREAFMRIKSSPKLATPAP